MRILLAEDDALTAVALARGLRENRHEVLLAADGDETLSLLRAVLPSVLVLDMALPYLDGIAVLSELPTLRLERAPRVVALSPFRDGWIASRALSLGATHVLPKPTELKRLCAVVEETGWRDIDAATHARVKACLSEMGISLRTRGGLYLMEAIELAARDFAAVERLRDLIYAPIAIKNATKAENVERLIRYAIETACTRGRLDVLHKFFGQTIRRETGKPTNAECISILAERARLGK